MDNTKTLSWEDFNSLKEDYEELKRVNDALHDVIESFNEFILLLDDPSKLFERILIKPQLCFLLNKDLSYQQIAKLCEVFTVVPIKIEDEDRFAIVCAVYKADPDRETELIDAWEENNA